jgi:C1A family cysteine protease
VVEQTPIDLDSLRDLLRDGGANWEPAPNPLTELSDEDFRRRLGYEADGGGDELSIERREAISADPDRQRPGSCSGRDWNADGYITPVKDQGGCGSCVAFGTLAAVEGMARIERGADLDLSEAHLFYCHAAAEGRNCGNGWWVANALDKLRDPGVVDEPCFPYTAGDQKCVLCDDWQGRLTRIDGWHAIDAVDEMKSWLCDRGPLVTVLTVYEDFRWYGSGVYSYVSGVPVGGHCVCCVGFDEAGGYWICKNSWGPAWGESGFFRIGFSQVGIDARMWAVDGVILP